MCFARLNMHYSSVSSECVYRALSTLKNRCITIKMCLLDLLYILRWKQKKRWLFISLIKKSKEKKEQPEDSLPFSWYSKLHHKQASGKIMLYADKLQLTEVTVQNVLSAFHMMYSEGSPNRRVWLSHFYWH